MAKPTGDLVIEASSRISVSPIELEAELTSDGVRLIDIRESMERDQHIEGAVQIPRGCWNSSRTLLALPDCPTTSRPASRRLRRSVTAIVSGSAMTG